MASIRDVAKMCGVSTATVSHVLNARSTKVSAETREKVFSAVRTLRYKPTPLETRQGAILTKNLSLVCGDLYLSPLHSNHYFAGVLDGVLEAAAMRERSVTVFVERMWSDSGDAVRRGYDGRCDGVIMLAPERNSNLVASLVDRGVPVLTVGAAATLEGVSSVDIDNRAAITELTQYLLNVGHTRIAYFGPGWHVPSSYERCEAFVDLMKDASLTHQSGIFLSIRSQDPLNTIQIPDAPEIQLAHGRNGVGLTHLAFGSSKVPPTAIICWNEEFAREAIATLASLGISVPAQVSIVCFDDSETSHQLTPHLTTVRQPLREIGVRAVEMLIDRTLDLDLPDHDVRLKAELVIRDSASSPTCSVASLPRKSIKQSLPMEVII